MQGTHNSRSDRGAHRALCRILLKADYSGTNIVRKGLMRVFRISPFRCFIISLRR